MNPIETINNFSQNTMVEHLGIIITEVSDKHISGKMPVDHRTHQPMGLLHGGASAAFAETLASYGANMLVMPLNKTAVGQNLHINHIKSVRTGWVFGKAELIHRGVTSQVWEIKIFNENNDLVADSSLTLAIINRR